MEFLLPLSRKYAGNSKKHITKTEKFTFSSVYAGIPARGKVIVYESDRYVNRLWSSRFVGGLRKRVLTGGQFQVSCR